MGVRRLCAIVVCFLASQRPVRAQSAELSGVVRDPSGGSISHASLEFRSQETGVRLRTTTNDEGFYAVVGLKPGRYDATLQATGFRILTRSSIELNVGDRAGLDFSLDLASASETVTVSAATTETRLTSLDGAVGTVVDQGFVGNIPLNGRSFQSLLHVTPGVTITRSFQDAPGQFSVNGQRTNANYFMVDGVSANFGSTASVGIGQTISGSTPGLNILGGTNSLVSVDAMQEFRILTSSYAAEYGRTPGAQISILTKSGTNQFHGTAFEYFRDDIFDARNWFNVVPQPKPPLRQNNFGGTFGGPILKDKTFFFLSYEGLRLEQPTTSQGNFLTAAARAQAAPVFQPFVNAFPIPTGPVNADGITAPLTGSYSVPSSFDSGSVRVDHAINDRIRLFGRFNESPSSQGSRFFSQNESDIADIRTFTAGMTMAISANKVNDFRVNWSRSIDQAILFMDNSFGAIAPPDSALFGSGASPAAQQVSLGTSFGSVSVGTRANNIQRQFNLVDSFSMTTGHHQLKFGVDFRRMRPTNSGSSGQFASVSTYASLLAGTVNAAILIASDPITVTLDNYSLFAQDTWKLRPNLTLSYGLRWEINTPPVSTDANKPIYAVDGIYNSNPVALVDRPLWQTKLTNFAPRAGVAWQLNQNNAIRAGFGLFYDLPYGTSSALALGFPYSRTAVRRLNPTVPFDLQSSAFQPIPFTTTLSKGVFLGVTDPNLTSPAISQWNVGWERNFGTNQMLTATYAGAWGWNLLRKDVVIPTSGNLADLGGWAGVTYNAGNSHYESLQVEFLRRMSRGVQVLASYVLSQSTDTGSTDVGLGSTAQYTQVRASSVSGLRPPPMAPSDFDTRHVLGAAVSWQLPAPGKVGRALLRNFTLDGIFRAKSAPALNVLYQWLYANGQYDVQPDVVPGQPFWIPDGNEPEGRALNPKAFTVPVSGGSGVDGNFPRNSLRGFSYNQIDLALRRTFSITERVKLDARVEYFNVLNHPSFASPLNLWGVGGGGPQASFGKVANGNTLNVGLGGGGLSGGQAPIYAPGGPRSAQFTLRLTF